MNSNMLTISCILPQTSPPSPSSTKLDKTNKNERFTFELDNETKDFEAQESVTTDNRDEIQPLQNDKQPLEEKEGIQDTKEIKDNTVPNRKDLTESNTDENSSDTEEKSSFESTVKDVTKNAEPKVGQQISELLTALKENKDLTISAEINEPAEIQELIQKRDDIYQRIKSVISGKSQDILAFNNDIKNEFVETIKNNVDADQLLLDNQSTVIIQEVQKNIEQAKAAINLSDLEGAAEVNKGENNAGEQIGITGQKEALSESIVNNLTGKKSTDGKESIFDVITSYVKTDASNSQKNIGENNLQEHILTHERLINKIEEFKENNKSTVTKESILGLNDLNGNSDIRKLNVVNINNLTNQKGGQTDSTSVNIDSKTKPIYSIDSSQTVTIEQPVSSGNVKVSNYVSQSSVSDVLTNVGKQILESIQSSLTNQVGDKQITVRLNPPELGKVLIKFQEQENQITGLLEASKTQTRIEIEQALPQIIRDLSDSGINIKRLEVVLTSSEQQEQESLNDYLHFNSEQQQQNSGNPEIYEKEYDMGGIHEWLDNSISYDNDSGLQDTLTVDNSINILI